MKNTPVCVSMLSMSDLYKYTVCNHIIDCVSERVGPPSGSAAIFVWAYADRQIRAWIFLFYIRWPC